MKARLLMILLACSYLSAGERQEAARRGDTAKIRQLLSNGMDINSPGEEGWTALHEAVASGQREVVELLLANGANRRAVDEGHRTPLALAYSITDKPLEARIVAALLQGIPIAQPKESNPWTLQYAALRNQVPVIEMLLQLKVDVNSVDTNGNRALNLACLKGNVQAARILLDHGADVNARSTAGTAPLHEAALSGSVAVGELLLSHGAKIDAIDEESVATALYYTVSFGRSDFAQLLIVKGASVNLKTKNAKIPLAAAKEMRMTDVETLLRKSGATDRL